MPYGDHKCKSNEEQMKSVIDLAAHVTRMHGITTLHARRNLLLCDSGTKTFQHEHVLDKRTPVLKLIKH